MSKIFTSRRAPRLLAMALAVTAGFALSGCAGLPGIGGPSPEEVKQQELFYDNLAIIRQGLLTAMPDLAVETLPESTWDETPPEGRQKVIEYGRKMCEEPIPTGAEGEGDRLMIWLSAKFFCQDRLPAAEASLVAMTSENTVKALELSLLRETGMTRDVLMALSLCAIETSTMWSIPAETFPTEDYFCWFMRANAIEQNGLESDFILMFKEDGEPETSFERYAELLGATPGPLAGLAG
ncbi:hypothetical protein ACWKWP_07335 [Agromyces soli]